MINEEISGLKTLDSKGTPPESRMSDPISAQSLVAALMNNDSARSRKRSLVKGLADGYPPYRASDLRKAGRADACNVNWRIAESYLASALGAFYDIFHEAETYSTIQYGLDAGPGYSEYSKIVTEEFDCMQKEDASFDYAMQISQYEMVLFGSGPLFYQDEFNWMCVPSRHRDVLIPERAKSSTDEWELCVVLQEYSPTELYAMIRNEQAASGRGWNVPATRTSIINATEDRNPDTARGAWEWHEQELKNNSFAYNARSKVIRCAHLLFREFPLPGEIKGGITHKIVLQSASDEGKNSPAFLFDKVRRYQNWNEVIHPMYYDHGGGGEHHSVVGMGVKMYSAMEYQNRLLCKMADDAFAPRTFFKPSGSSDKQKMMIANFGPYGIIPPNLNMEQGAINPFLNESISLNRELSSIVSSNLSQYRQGLGEKSGNPITAREADIRSSEQARLGATQLNRYYAQLDSLYAERYRRAVSPSLTATWPGGSQARAFIQRCINRGVPPEVLRKAKAKVLSSRVVGSGSLAQRQQSLEFLLGMVAMLPEMGRTQLVRDVIAARAGQKNADRYYPPDNISRMSDDQQAEAMDKVAGMKVGIPPMVTSSQNPAIYASVFIRAANDAIDSLQQGAAPEEVLAFLDLAGPSIAAHLDRMRGDATRKGAINQMESALKDISTAADQLRAAVEQRVAEQAQAQRDQAEVAAIQSGQDPKSQIEMAKTQHAMMLTELKTRGNMQLKAEKTRQDMAIKDAMAAQKFGNGGQ